MTATSFIPPGFLTLRDAVDRTGQHCHGADWTGSEIQQLDDPKRPLDRLEAAVEQIRGLLALDKIKAIAIAQNGNVFPVESSVWRAENGRQLFDAGLLPVGNLQESLLARNNRSHLRQILLPEDELIALLEDIPTVSKRKRRRRIEADEDLEHRIKLVIKFAEDRWSDLNDRPKFMQMAKELETRYGHAHGFKAQTIGKILRGTYPPARRLKIQGLR